MVGYRRNKLKSTDAVYFLTMVSRNRERIFTGKPLQDVLLTVMERLAEWKGCDYVAWVLLPDHIHWLVRPGDNDYSKLVYSFKYGVGAELKKIGQLAKGRKIWQDRFWEHTVMDDEDLRQCIEYIHYNPVKHGYADAPSKWTLSSFMDFVDEDLYPEDWADGGEIAIPGAEYD